MLSAECYCSGGWSISEQSGGKDTTVSCTITQIDGLTPKVETGVLVENEQASGRPERDRTCRPSDHPPSEWVESAASRSEFPQQNTTDTPLVKMSTSGRNNAGSEGEVEEETSDAKIERLVTEIEELKASLFGVPELSDEWFRIKTDIKDRDTERLLLIEKKRCDAVVKEYFEENPNVVETAPECPVCLEKMFGRYSTVRFICCGKQICQKCVSQGGSALNTCFLCRGAPPTSVDESIAMTKEKADSGIAWAQEEMGDNYLNGRGVPEDIEKAFSLIEELAEKGSSRAKCLLGSYYKKIGKYEEARQWPETAAAEGEIYSLFLLGRMMKAGQAFDQNEDTRAEEFRLFTISTTLFGERFNPAASELARFFSNSLPVMLHYLRPAVEGGSASSEEMDVIAVGLVNLSLEYYGEKGYMALGHCPLPEALFWHRRSNAARRPDDADSPRSPFTRIERAIREICAQCHADLPEGKKSCCVECKAAYYCNRDCQMAHWKAGHKKDCVRKLKKRLKAAGTL